MAAAAQRGQDGIITFMDFKPDVIDPGSKYCMPQYECFSGVVQKANEWLSLHPEVKVQTCESVDVPLINDVNKQLNLDCGGSVFYELNNKITHHMIFLRLWLLPNDPSDKACQQIGYVNQLPVCTDPGGSFSLPKFESLRETLGKFNERSRTNPLPGRVINIETQQVAFYKYKHGVDPEKTCWTKLVNKMHQFMQYMRVYYLLGKTTYEEIGCADFVPQCLKKPTSVSLGKYEALDTVIQRAHEWICQNPTISVTNGQIVKSIAEKHNKYDFDPQSLLGFEVPSGITFYVKVFRIYYTQNMPGYEDSGIVKAPVLLTSRTFTPAQLTFGGKYRCAKFENMEESVKRLQAWCQITGVKILCAETTFLSEFSQEKVLALDPDKSHCMVLGNKIMCYIATLCVYFDGTFHEPPQEVLPPLPEITKEDDDECCIS